jgi:hypothetical protein
MSWLSWSQENETIRGFGNPKKFSAALKITSIICMQLWCVMEGEEGRNTIFKNTLYNLKGIKNMSQ